MCGLKMPKQPHIQTGNEECATGTDETRSSTSRRGGAKGLSFGMASFAVPEF